MTSQYKSIIDKKEETVGQRNRPYKTGTAQENDVDN